MESEKVKEKNVSSAESSINSLLDLLGGQVTSGIADSGGRLSRFGPQATSVAQESKSVTDQLLQVRVFLQCVGVWYFSADWQRFDVNGVNFNVFSVYVIL